MNEDSNSSVMFPYSRRGPSGVGVFQDTDEIQGPYEGKYLVEFSTTHTRITPIEIVLISFLLILNGY